MTESHSELPTVDENKLIALRREKLNEIRGLGVAFPNDFRREHLAQEMQTAYAEHDAVFFQSNPIFVSVAGRVMLRRIMGKASFITLQDVSGQIQTYIQLNSVGAEVYERFKTWDLGDIVGVVGTLFRTKTGELTVHATEIRLLTKALRPLPDKFHGLQDQELRYRQRYVDLIANADTRQTFLMRSQIIGAIRQFLTAQRFLEVETPMMHTLPGGAAARPFATHHNALDMPLFLRIAPELFLKRLVVGGFERVFEINRNFRNEGLSTQHNPEFTMLEFYWAYADYRDLMDLTETLFRYLADTVLQKSLLDYQQHQIDLSQPFRRVTMVDAILEQNPQWSRTQLTELSAIRELLQQQHLEFHENDGVGKLQTRLFEETVEATLIQPTFVTAYPAEVSPLARRNDDNPEITDRFELFIVGREIANGFSELNDPEDQAARFQQQVAARTAGDDEAMFYDADYIRALEYGMPPTAGEGIGIDRLVMLFTNAPSIRDVLLFPHMRPES